MVWSGRAYIRSMEILSNPATCASWTACMAWLALWRRPMSCSRWSWKDWTPMLRRLMPIARHACAFSRVISPGLASMVISCGRWSVHVPRMAWRMRARAVVSKVLGVPPPIYIVCMGSDNWCWRICHSARTASTYCACFCRWVVEKKSQYLQRLLQNGICMYMPAISSNGCYWSASMIPFAKGLRISSSGLRMYPLVMAAMPHPSAGLQMMMLRRP